MRVAMTSGSGNAMTAGARLEAARDVARRLGDRPLEGHGVARVLVDGRRDEAGLDVGNADADGRQIDAQRLEEGAQGSLARAVRRRRGQAADAREAGDADDVAALLRHEDGDGGDDGREGAAHVDVEDGADVLPGEARAEHGVAPARVGDDHVEAAEVPIGALDRLGRSVRVAQVDGDAVGLAPEIAHLRRHPLELRSPSRGQRDASAPSRVLQRQRLPDAARGAGDEEGAGTHEVARSLPRVYLGPVPQPKGGDRLRRERRTH